MSQSKVSKECPHHPLELSYLISLADGCKSVLEIGSRYGETLKLLGERMGKGRIVAVDLPGIQPWGYPDSEEKLKQNIESLKEKGFDAHLFIGDSSDSCILSTVTALGPYDLVFIDADHRYEGVRSDWLNYGPLGKMVVFHDIVKHPDGAKNAPEVWKLWKELRGRKVEFVAYESVMGLGIIYQG